MQVGESLFQHTHFCTSKASTFVLGKQVLLGFTWASVFAFLSPHASLWEPLQRQSLSNLPSRPARLEYFTKILYKNIEKKKSLFKGNESPKYIRLPIWRARMYACLYISVFTDIGGIWAGVYVCRRCSRCRRMYMLYRYTPAYCPLSRARRRIECRRCRRCRRICSTAGVAGICRACTPATPASYTPPSTGCRQAYMCVGVTPACIRASV
jgi:hypothetical protein